jgi:uncharacterized protein (TIGR02270 family)
MIEDVLSQHAEEAAFQWLLRDLAVHAPHYDLGDLAELDDRVEAHLDGLSIAGDAGWEIAKGQLSWQEPGEVFTLSALAFESADPRRAEEAMAAASEDEPLARGVISALGWVPPEAARPHIQNLLNSEDPVRRRVGIGGAAVHREDPGPLLRRVLDWGERPTYARALKMAGELGRRDLAHLCAAALESDDSEEKFWAAWSAALLGNADAASRALFEVALASVPRSDRAGDLLARVKPPGQVLAWHSQLAEEPQRARLACRVAGAVGEPGLVTWLIQAMAVDEVARPAGESFSMITGVDLALANLDRDWPEGLETGPSEDPEDEDVSLDPDEALPWPDSEKVRVWWEDNGQLFSAGTRHLCGRPISEESLWETLRLGLQRQRAAAALELALRDPAAPLFETRARGDRQRQWLKL